MPLPQTIRVKLSSEAAEAISLTPVVVQDLPILELIEHILGVTGKDEPRIREILLRGTVVSGASRFRWTGWEPDGDSLREALGAFPDPDPSREFSHASCIRVILRGGRQSIEITRETVGRPGLLRRTTFWDHLMDLIAAGPSSYSGYSYRDRADRYVRELSVEEAERLRIASDAVRYSTLRDQIRSVAFVKAELLVKRAV
jgi:hypothetical protein